MTIELPRGFLNFHSKAYEDWWRLHMLTGDPLFERNIHFFQIDKFHYFWFSLVVPICSYVEAFATTYRSIWLELGYYEINSN